MSDQLLGPRGRRALGRERRAAPRLLAGRRMPQDANPRRQGLSCSVPWERVQGTGRVTEGALRVRSAVGRRLASGHLQEAVLEFAYKLSQVAVTERCRRRPRHGVVGSWEDLWETLSIEHKRATGRNLVYTEDLERKACEREDDEVRPRFAAISTIFQKVDRDESVDVAVPRPVADPGVRVNRTAGAE